MLLGVNARVVIRIWVICEAIKRKQILRYCFLQLMQPSRGASGISIHSPDTDVLVLAVRRYPLLCPSITFVTGTGQKRRSIPLKPIYDALGPMKAAALPGFHAISGCDNTGSFSGKGKEKQLSGKLSSMLLMIFFKRLERLVQEKWNYPVLRRVMP